MMVRELNNAKNGLCKSQKNEEIFIVHMAGAKIIDI